MADVNEREILTACLRWHTLHVRRLEIGAAKRRLDKAEKEAYDRDDFQPSDCPAYFEACRVRAAAREAGARLTSARRAELAALRALAKTCAMVRASQTQVDDAAVIEVHARVTYEPLQHPT